MSEHVFYRKIKKLEAHKFLHIKSHNKYTLGTIEKWPLYQGRKPKSAQVIAQQTDTIKEVKEILISGSDEIDTFLEGGNGKEKD